jgi:cytochrome c
MTRIALTALLVAGIAACGQGGDPAATARGTPEAGGPSPSAPPPGPGPEQKAALLASLPSPYNAADLDNGRRVFARCRACHTTTEGGPNMTGPNLHGVFGREAGGLEGYNYSSALQQADFVWDGERLDHWLENPRTFLQGTKMAFPGIPDAADRRDVIAFLEIETGYRPPAAP